MKDQVNNTEKTRERKTKEIHISLTDKDYDLLEEGKEKRNLDTGDYIRYLISNDIDDFPYRRVTDALNRISVLAEVLSEKCYKCQCGKESTIRPFTIDIMEGVNMLWECI